MKKTLSVLIAGALVAGLFTGCGNKEKEVTLNVGIQPSVAFVPVYVAKETGWLEEALAESQVKVNWNEFESGPPINESMAAGKSDIGTQGDVPTVSSIAAGQKNIIAGILCNGPDAYNCMVRADDTSINDFSDLKGKKVATVLGSTGHNLIKKLLEKYNMTFNDIELVNISAGDASTVLATGNVDAVVIWEPNVTRIVDSGVARIINRGSDTDLYGTNTLVVRIDYAKKHPEVITKCLEIFEKSAKAIPTLDEETWAKVAADMKLTPEQLRGLMPKYQYNMYNTPADTAHLQDTIKFLVAIGKLDEEYDITKHIDETFYENIGK